MLNTADKIYWQREGNQAIQIKMLWGLHQLIYVEHIELCLVGNKDSINSS